MKHTRNSVKDNGSCSEYDVAAEIQQRRKPPDSTRITMPTAIETIPHVRMTRASTNSAGKYSPVS